jgi:hypothetical protein
MMKIVSAQLLCILLLLAGCQKKEEEFKSLLRMTLGGKLVQCDRSIEASGNYIRGTNLTTHEASGNYIRGTNLTTQKLSISGN